MTRDPTKMKPNYHAIEEPMKYQPKGSLCGSCKHMMRSCSHLPFHEMPMHKVKDKLTIVICTEFEKDV